jgi:hypothetical protein
MRYKRLDEKKNEIRVLRFVDLSSPFSIGNPIKCSIDNVPLEERSPHSQSDHGHLTNQNRPIVWDGFTNCVDLRDAVLERTKRDEAPSFGLLRTRYAWGDFEALSYTWGEAGDEKSIIVNGISKKVSKNLEEALRALRDLEETRLGMRYWVDSLCINQKDEEERNKQVKRMREIYGRARAVIVWLGQEEKTDRTAVRTMYHLCRTPYVKTPLKLPYDLLATGWHALFAFAQKPYWTRAWIIQELATNHNSTLILCGKYKLTRRMIRLGATYLHEFLTGSEDQSYQSDHDLVSNTWPKASRMHRLASLTSNPAVEVMLNPLLNLVRRAEATDDRDKVYSILGLLDPAISADIIPNYKLSVKRVYTDYTIAMIKNSRSLDQIIYGGIPAQKGWSSWVPDWRLPFERHHIQYLRRRQASGNIPAQFRFVNEDKNGHLLVCDGFQVDTVDDTTAVTRPHRSEGSPRCTSNRYMGRTREALEQTLLMGHPGATKKALLKIPWTSGYEDSPHRTNSSQTTQWPKLFQSSYFQEFHQFRERHQDFCIAGKKFRSFFSHHGVRRLDTTTLLPCMRLAVLSLHERDLITTETGYLGLAPKAVRPGDVVAILFGCKCPVVLRPQGDDTYHVIGECYIHELMDGEVLSRGVGEHALRREFVLC